MNEKNQYYFDSIVNNFEMLTNRFDITTRLDWFSKQFDRFEVRGKQVLDVGCGLGQFSHLVIKYGGFPIPFDIGGKLLSKVSPDIPNCIQGTVMELPFQDNAFSYIISSECIEHTPDPVLSLREILRVLAPGGYIILTTPNYFWRWSVNIATILGIRQFVGMENWLTRRKVQKILADSKTIILVNEGLYLLPFQISILWPVIKLINQKGQVLKGLMINQCWVAQKL